MQTFHLQVISPDSNLRLDQYLIEHLPAGFSRSHIQRLIKEHKILVNGQIFKANYKVKAGDALVVNIPQAQEPAVEPEQIPLKIVFEDEDVLVIEKPSGLVTHPGIGNYAHTLVSALLNYGCSLSTVNGPLRPGIVHRLDKDTSGLMLIAKNDFAHQKLAQQFREHTIKRKYIALVRGNVAYDEGVIDYPLARDPQHRQMMKVSFLQNAKNAVTRYKVLKRYKGTTLLELTPHTGRTHQLRVHLKFCGHPILGDVRYGRAAEFSRLALHATEIGFCHPRTEKFIEFRSEPEPAFFLHE